MVFWMDGIIQFLFVFFVLLKLNVPVNNFSVMSGRRHHFMGITSTIGGVNVLKEVGL